MMDYINVANYSEVMCTVIQNMIDANLSKIKCDRTVKAVIIDDSKANYNYYTVSENNIDYIAYSTGEIYKKGESVYITIPNGNYDEQKFIMGRGYDDSSLDNLESIELKNFVAFDDSINSDKIYGLIANGEKSEIKILPESKTLFEESSTYWIQELGLDGDSFIDFDYFMISANFITTLPECRGGTFGLKVILSYLDKQNVSRNKSYLFLNNDMYGNIYQLKGATQKFLMKLDKENINKILDIKIYLYQQKDFINKDRQLINSNVENIILEKLSIQYGYDKNNITENDIKIQANTDKTYLDSNENLGSIQWRFLVKGSSGQNLRITYNQQLVNPEVSKLNQAVLFYDKKFKAPEGSVLERDQWREINNPGFIRGDFPDGILYNKALGSWQKYSDSIGKDLEHFTFSSFKGYYDGKQDKTGIEIVLYITDEYGNIKILNRKLIFFEKREKRE